MPDRNIPQRWSEPANLPTFTPATEQDGSADSLSLLESAAQLLGLAKRHWLIVALCVASALGVAFLFLRQQMPVYRATAVIRMVDKSKSLSGGLGTSLADQMGGSDADPILSAIQILTSRDIAKQIASRQGLRLEAVTRGFPWGSVDSVTVDADARPDTVRLAFDGTGASASAGALKTRADYGQPLEIGGVRMRLLSNPGMQSADFVVVSLSRAADDIVRSLRGHPRERTDVADVTFEATDPVLAARTVNAATEVFQQVSAARARAESQRRRDFIEQQLAKTVDLLAAAQAQHNAFRSNQKVYSSDEKFQAAQSALTAIELQRNQLAADRQMYASLLATLDSTSAASGHDVHLNALLSSPGIATNVVVGQLFTELLRLRAQRDSLTGGIWGRSARNPDVQQLDGLIATARTNVAAGVRGQIAAVDAQLAALDRLRDQTSSRIATMPAAQAREADLIMAESTYAAEATGMRAELHKAEIDVASEAGNVEIVDSAEVPRLPIGSGKLPKLMLALILGLGAGLGIAYATENLRSVIRRREDLESIVAVPILAVIPRFEGLFGPPMRSRISRLVTPVRATRAVTAGNDNGNGNGISNGNGNGNDHTNGNGNGHANGTPRVTDVTASEAGALVLLTNPMSQAAEAFRTLRTNLLFSSAVKSLKYLVVTSAGPGEGKSTTASNLAIAFAQQGQRVLLVDCDLRRPRLHRLFATRSLPGLTNVITGQSTLELAVQPTQVANLRTLVSGPVPPNPVELLGSAQMQLLLGSLTDVDLVVFDTPPLLVASDAAILSRLADGVLLVARAGHTGNAALSQAVQHLHHVGARVIGTVLNDRDDQVARYSRNYQAEYGSRYYMAQEV